jgi:hypothetical protein
MKIASAIGDLPAAPAVYSLYGGTGSRRYVAYVGVADNVRQRIRQHLLSRSSSVVTGVAAVSLNPALVTMVEWWEHDSFQHPVNLKAAELVAFKTLDPVLRSRGNVPEHVEALARDPAFVREMQELFASEPGGRFVRTSLEEVLNRISALDARIAAHERLLASIVHKLGDEKPS